MDNGWIKIHRKILKWEWYSDPITKSVFFDLLLTTNHEPTKYRGITISTGQTITGYPAMAQRLGISVQNARTAINHLKSTGELTVKSTNRFSVITLLNYTKYQLTQNETNRQTNRPANSQLTGNQQATNNTQEVKNEKNLRTTTQDEVFKKLAKWLSGMDDVTSPDGLARKFMGLYPRERIAKALRNPQCTSRNQLSKLCSGEYETKELLWQPPN